MKELVSIIVPIYNCEKNIEKLIKTIVNQTYKNIEIILINDGSNDKSIKKCLKFKEIDDRIIIIDKPNEGVSKTRNYGIKIATGEYIMFVDADDLLPIDAVEKLYLESNSYSWIVGNYKIINQNKVGKMKSFASNNIDFFRYKILNKYYDNKQEDSGNLRTVWGKLYKRNIIIENNVWFDEKIKLFEDGIFNLNYLDFCENVKLIDNIVYFYKIEEQSAIHKYYKDFYTQDKLRIEFLENKFKNNDKYKEVISLIVFEFFLDYLKNIYKSENKVRLKNLMKKQLIYFNYFNNIKIKYLSSRQRIVYILLRLKLFTILEKLFLYYK